MIGSRHVSVGADDEADATITEMSHRLLLACRLGVDVDDDRIGGLLERTCRKLALDRGKRIIERVHEDAAHGVDDQDARAVLGFDQRDPTAGRAGGEVDRTKQLGRAFDENQRLLLVPGMIAAGNRVGAGVDELLVDRLGDTEAAGGILAIHRDEIEPPVPHQPGQALEQHGAPAASHDVADEQDTHALRGPAIDDLVLG